MRRAIGGALALALAFMAASPAAAHEIGKTQVTAVVRGDGAYRIDVLVDPDVLLTKLEVYGGTSISSGLSRIERDRRIEALASVFLDRVSVRFDGARDRPRFQYLPASGLGDLAQTASIVRLTGTVPAFSRQLTFAYGLALGSYALNVRIGDSPLQTFWLDGPNPSAPVSLIAPPPPATRVEIARQYFGLGYTHILPNGLDHILAQRRQYRNSSSR